MSFRYIESKADRLMKNLKDMKTAENWGYYVPITEENIHKLDLPLYGGWKVLQFIGDHYDGAQVIIRRSETKRQYDDYVIHDTTIFENVKYFPTYHLDVNVISEKDDGLYHRIQISDEDTKNFLMRVLIYDIDIKDINCVSQ